MKRLSAHIKKAWASLALLSVELLIVLLLFLSSIIGFGFMVYRVFSIHNDQFDFAVFGFLERFTTPLNTKLMLFFTFFATHNFLISANIALIAWFLLIKRHKWYSIRIPVVAIGSVSLMLLLKLYFSRPRPLSPLLQAAHGFSFPSGHAMSAVSFYGLLVYLVWHNVKRAWVKWALSILLSFIILMIGFSRIYLRVHYTSDVIAGFSMGIIWLVTSLFLTARIECYTRRKIDPAIS